MRQPHLGGGEGWDIIVYDLSTFDAVHKVGHWDNLIWVGERGGDIIIV